MLQKSSLMRTAEFFYKNPTRDHYLMDISRHIGLAHTSTKKNLKELAKGGIISKHSEKKGGRVYPLYRGNFDNRLFKSCKRIHNLSAIIDSGLVDYIEEKLMPKSIVLFGSYSRGEDTETSDIDIFVECKGEQLNLKNFEKNLGRKIQLHFKESFSSFPKELRNNMVNGIILSGFLEAYP